MALALLSGALRRSARFVAQGTGLCRGAGGAEAQQAALPQALAGRALFTCSAARSDSTGGADEPAPSRATVNRLLYRSRQRGFLEMDLLVGLFAERRLPQMAERELAAFSAVLDQENPDLFKWLTGQEPAPDAMLANATFVELREHVHGQLAAHCAPGAASVPGKAWVRGWDDSQKAPARPQQAE